MITGVVTPALEATIQLTLYGPQTQRAVIEAVVDTGYDGYLTLPSSVVTRLGLPWRRRTRGLLADGSGSLFDIYEGEVDWDGRRRRIAIDAVDSAPLLGTSLLRGHELLVEVVGGGRVLVRALGGP